jgi:hypothetical protein
MRPSNPQPCTLHCTRRKTPSHPLKNLIEKKKKKLTRNQIGDDNLLSYNGNSTFFADKVPMGHVQSKIFAHGDVDNHAIELSVAWFET